MMLSSPGDPSVRRLVSRASDIRLFPVAAVTGNAFGLAFLGNFLLELIDDVFQLLSAAQRVFVGFGHIAFHWPGWRTTGTSAGAPPLFNTRSRVR
ncbi:hypothetical protein A5682_22565 [Mycobacterium mantenii]|uniref:Uncharacterized protein n=1 Tax=Mycobacterium mantenii TaxID=560555 RepID=A0A1A2T4J1_MYCNT|nr:hypothetical protein A5688_05415 [Mycobacterium mantenii]OBH71315.1 hypothetical protein A5683_26815 [Mycobacterium mantenii]OBH77697.1 hypothetical protein A5682_22565 [Mycobacterium mantenii]